MVTSLRSSVAAGVSWGVVGLAASRTSAIVTQVMLGLLLSPIEWGIYAGAVSISSLAMSMRDGGMVDVLARTDPAEVLRLVRPAMSISLLTNLALAAAMMAASVALAGRLGGADVVVISGLLAVALIVQTPAAVLRGVLRSHLRFRELAAISTVAAILRAAATVGFAWAGFGALSFVVGVPVIGAVEVGVLWWVTRSVSIAGRSDQAVWRALVGSGAWLTLATGGTALTIYGDYLVLGLFLLPSALGLYYFAFQLVAQTATMIIAALEPVLVPVLSRLKHTDRVDVAVAGTVRLLVLALGTVSVTIGLVFHHIDAVVWNSRWVGAVGAVQVLSLGFALRGTVVVTRALLISHGRFRQAAVQAWVVGLGLVGVAAIVGIGGATPTVAAAAVTGYLMISSLLALAYALRLASIGARSILEGALASWSLTLVVGLVWSAFDRIALPGLTPVLRSVCVSLGYGLSIVVVARAAAPDDLRRLLEALPLPTRKLMRALAI